MFKLFKSFMMALVPFLGGMVVAVNLVFLVPTNPEFIGEWWRVLVGITMSFVLPIAASYEE